jgi:hypothetical protein
MITNLGIGYEGRLSNQIFQFSILYLIHLNNGFEIKLPIENSLIYDRNFSKLDIFSLFEISSKFLCPRNEIKIDKSISFSGNPQYTMSQILELNDFTDIHGEFQISDYYIKYKSELLNLYKNRSFIEDYANECLNTINKGRETVGIHVRKTDFLLKKKMLEINPEYYYNIIQKYFNSDKYVFVIFTDDVRWCKDNLFIKNCEYISDISHEVQKNVQLKLCNHIFDFVCMTQCDHIIGVNSTFSWWTTFLNKKRGFKIMPKKWYNDNISSKSYDTPEWFVYDDSIHHYLDDIIYFDNDLL